MNIVLGSTSSIPLFLPYAESALRSTGIPCTILRNNQYADPIVDWAPKIVQTGIISSPTQGGRCAYVTRDGVAVAGRAELTTESHADDCAI